MCRAKGIKVLVSSATQSFNKCMISERPTEFDDSSISDSEISMKFTSFSDLVKNIGRQSDVSSLAYNKTIKSYNEKWRASNRKRASAAMEFLFNSNNKNTKTHFAYFGRSKSSVLLLSLIHISEPTRPY